MQGYIINEKHKGDKKKIQNHLEDITIFCPTGIEMAVKDYSINPYRDSLIIHLEPSEHIYSTEDYSKDYSIMVEPPGMKMLKRKIIFTSIQNGCLVADVKAKGKKGKHTHLMIHPQKI